MESLKSQILDKIASIKSQPLPSFGFNQKYAGAKFDLAKLSSCSWKELQKNFETRGIWLERTCILGQDNLLEFRVYFSSMGHWRTAMPSIFCPGSVSPGDVRAEAKSIPDEITRLLSEELDSALTEDISADFSSEMASVSDLDDMSKVPDGMDEHGYRLSLWRNTVEKNFERDHATSKRFVSCAVRHGHFCNSGYVIAYTAFVAYNIGMGFEASVLFKHAVDEENENTAEYWNLVGSVLERLNFNSEAFECFSLAHSMNPGCDNFRKNIWVAGRKHKRGSIRGTEYCFPPHSYTYSYTQIAAICCTSANSP